MRVTSETNFRMLADAINRQQINLQHYQQTVASGKAVTKASDDPGAFGKISTLSSDLSQLQQYSRNVNTAMQYHATVDQSLSSAVNLLHRINELVVQAGDGTMEGTSREALSKEVDSLMKSLLSVANGSEGGRYTFSGLRTDTQPYETVLDPVDGRITAVNYVGSEESRSIKTGDSLYTATNFPGSSTTSESGIFQTPTRDIFASLIQLRDALAADQDVTMTGLPAQLQADLDHMLDCQSLNGVREEQVNLHKTFLLEMQTANKTSTSELESVDLASEMIKLSQSENAYQAALGSVSRLLRQVNLMDYI